MLRAKGIAYELAERARGMAFGGVGLMLQLARRVGLVQAIDERVQVLKRHLPYHESDHVLNIAFNVLAGGTCLEDLELLRKDEVYLDSLGAQRIPDPTTAGDFCRRFDDKQKIDDLMDSINEARLSVWSQQPDEFFDLAVLDADGTVAPTTGECKEEMDFNHPKKVWGYHPLLVSLANTREPLFLDNRSGNRPSHEGAATRLDQARELCERAGFRKVLMRGDTDFSQTKHLDRWDDQGVQFVFGYDAMANLKAEAESLRNSAWKRLMRPPKYQVKTEPRAKPERVKERLVKEKEYLNIRLNSEEVAEFEYRPTACKKTYRMVVVRKNLTQERGEQRLFDEIRYFFYITNLTKPAAAEIVAQANKRCEQENLIEQLKNGPRSMRMPVDNLLSNWAYMVMTSLAWTLKAWFALLLPTKGRWKKKHASEKEAVLRMEFKTFLAAFMRLPAQLVRTGNRLVFRLLSWNPWQHVFFRAVDALHRPLRC